MSMVAFLGLCILLFLGSLSAPIAHAVEYTSSTGRIEVKERSGSLRYEPAFGKLTGPNLYDASYYDTMQGIDDAMIWSLFAPDRGSLVPRNGGQNPTAYEVIDPGDASNPLSLIGNVSGNAYQTNFRVMNVAGSPYVPVQWNYMLSGMLLKDSSATPPRDSNLSTAAVSIFFMRDQSSMAFDLTGIDYTNVSNPDSRLFVDFFARNGTFLDHINIPLPRPNGDPQNSKSLLFITESGLDEVAGFTITTSDTAGLGYGAFAFNTPVPPSLLLLLTGVPMLALLRAGQRRAQI